MYLNKDQTEKATKLLGLFCESNNLTNTQVASFFDNDNEEAAVICKALEKDDLLKVTWSDGNRINGIDKKESTCHAFKDDTLMKEFIARERLAKTATIDLKIKRIELWKQYWWLAGAIFTIIIVILYVIVFLIW